MSSIANRVIKNTGFLYAKMGITMFISLYTTRLILNSLGASDFGIFNIVGGAISMLGFLNAAMASATQRFMSYSEGEGNKEKQKSIFNVSFILHLGISFIVGIVLLVAGYFFFNGILKIPEDRIFAAQVVYGSLIVSTMFTVMTVPYDAAMNAHENMKYYAIVGIFESLLKLSVAFACVYTNHDKLIVYGALMACIPLVTLSIMRIYCLKNYEECVVAPRRYWNNTLMKEMTSFAGWNLFSSMISMITMQGVSVVLNSFFGVIANAAQGIANQLSGQIMVFSNTMLKALNPVIVKNEGAKERNKMLEITMSGSKFSFLIMCFFSIPFCIEAPYILKLWLNNPPDYAVLFCRLVLLRLSISQLTITFGTAIAATGKIKKITLVTSIIMAFVLPTSILLYKLNFPIYTIYVVLIIMVCFLFMSNIYFIKKYCELNIIVYIKFVLLPCLFISIITSMLGCVVTLIFKESLFRLLSVILITTTSFALMFYKIGLSSKERESLLILLKKIKNDRLFRA